MVAQAMLPMRSVAHVAHASQALRLLEHHIPLEVRRAPLLALLQLQHHVLGVKTGGMRPQGISRSLDAAVNRARHLRVVEGEAPVAVGRVGGHRVSGRKRRRMNVRQSSWGSELVVIDTTPSAYMVGNPRLTLFTKSLLVGRLKIKVLAGLR